MFERLSLGDAPVYWRAFLGLTAWQPGQLDAELSGTFPYNATNSWLICDANDDILFNCDGEQQWKQAIELCSHQMIQRYF
jgi:putative transcriptional regulator